MYCSCLLFTTVMYLIHVQVFSKKFSLKLLLFFIYNYPLTFGSDPPILPSPPNVETETGKFPKKMKLLGTSTVSFCLYDEKPLIMEEIVLVMVNRKSNASILLNRSHTWFALKLGYLGGFCEL